MYGLHKKDYGAPEGVKHKDAVDSGLVFRKVGIYAQLEPEPVHPSTCTACQPSIPPVATPVVPAPLLHPFTSRLHFKVLGFKVSLK